MQIVLPGALPDPAQMRALNAHLDRAAPTLQRWRSRGRAHHTPAAAAQTHCTAYEQWRLTRRGFVPDPGQHLAAGLGPLLAQSPSSGVSPTSDDPLWLAELVHIALASDGAALIPARRLDIRAQDSQALFASAQAVCEGSGFTLQPHNATHWRVVPSEPMMLRCASPELVAASSVHEWWPQDAQARAWRKVFNTLQMHWFDHPVNRTRAARDLLPINGLWLFGGARPAQLPPEPAQDLRVYDSLYDPWQQKDWGAWLEALADLERTVFAPLARAPDSLVLIGHAQVTDVRPAAGLHRVWRWFSG